MASRGTVASHPIKDLINLESSKLWGANIGSNSGTTSPCEAAKNHIDQVLDSFGDLPQLCTVHPNLKKNKTNRVKKNGGSNRFTAFTSGL